ncbi:MAG: hypothetical protein JXR87_00945, partial [Candidatus Marinimicrobia bacterium]|nr:hypothetical protein [Candidatus Neomarinimicrobiota bacterium]
MKYSLIITLIFSLQVHLQAEDSHTAIMQYLESTKLTQSLLETTHSVDIYPVKSLMIHPNQRETLLGKASFSRPTLTGEQEYISDDGHFTFHYTTAGYDAVEITSTNEDDVPDYIYEAAIAAEYVYRILIDTLGFDPPPVDDYTSPEMDIYVLNFGGSVYAYTYPENKVSATSRPNDWTAYMEIDNDYKELAYTTNGFDGLRVTIAHEYFHVIQLGYNWWDDNGLQIDWPYQGDQYFLEWSSTWFEERAYPEINDYIQYLGGFFNNPDKSVWNSDYAYAMGPFIYFLMNRYDENLLTKTWGKIKNQFAFQALQETIGEYGGDLATQYNSYVSASYFTGSRYDEDFAISPDARYYPTLSIPVQSFNNNLSIDKSINPIATCPLSISFSSNQYLNLFIESPGRGEYKGSYVIDKYLSANFLRKFSDQTEIFIGEARKDDHLIVFFTNTSAESTRNLNLMLTMAETFPTKILELWANPYSSQRYASLKFNLQLGKFIDKLQLQIYNLLGQQVYSRII